MSQMTREINKVTSTIIGISGKLIIYAVVILLLVEGMTRGYAFGYSIFYSKPMEEAPGTEKTVTVAGDQSASDTARMLKDLGLISNDLAVLIQMKFYDYNIYPGTYTLSTAMTSKEILQALNEKPEKEEEDASQAAPGTKTDTGETAAAGDNETSGQSESSEQQGGASADEASVRSEDGASGSGDAAGGNMEEPEVEIQINAVESDGRPA